MPTEPTNSSLYERLVAARKEAFVAREKRTDSLLGTLLGDATTAARRKVIRDPSDLELIALLRTYVANAKVMAEAFEKNGRSADAENARAEVAILSEYLPPEISTDDIRTFLEGLKAAGAVSAGPKGMGDAVKALKEKYGDGFDGKVMTPIAKEILGI